MMKRRLTGSQTLLRHWEICRSKLGDVHQAKHDKDLWVIIRYVDCLRSETKRCAQAVHSFAASTSTSVPRLYCTILILRQAHVSSLTAISKPPHAKHIQTPENIHGYTSTSIQKTSELRSAQSHPPKQGNSSSNPNSHFVAYKACFAAS